MKFSRNVKFAVIVAQANMWEILGVVAENIAYFFECAAEHAAAKQEEKIEQLLVSRSI